MRKVKERRGKRRWRGIKKEEEEEVEEGEGVEKEVREGGRE